MICRARSHCCLATDGRCYIFRARFRCFFTDGQTSSRDDTNQPSKGCKRKLAWAISFACITCHKTNNFKYKKNAHGNNKHSTINLFHSFIYRWLPIQFSNYTFSTIYFFYFGFGVLFHNGAKKYFSGTVGRPCAKSLAADGCDVNYDPAQRCCGY